MKSSWHTISLILLWVGLCSCQEERAGQFLREIRHGAVYSTVKLHIDEGHTYIGAILFRHSAFGGMSGQEY